jgi:hypothetical protein
MWSIPLGLKALWVVWHEIFQQTDFILALHRQDPKWTWLKPHRRYYQSNFLWHFSWPVWLLIHINVISHMFYTQLSLLSGNPLIPAPVNYLTIAMKVCAAPYWPNWRLGDPVAAVCSRCSPSRFSDIKVFDSILYYCKFPLNVNGFEWLYGAQHNTVSASAIRYFNTN